MLTHFTFLCVVQSCMQSDRDTDEHAHRQEKGLTETAVAIVHHEISSQGSGGEVIYAAGPVRHVPHHNGICLREPEMCAHRVNNQCSDRPYAIPDVRYHSDQYIACQTQCDYERAE